MKHEGHTHHKRRTGGMTGTQGSTMLKEEWLTPPHILAELGGFDLDPCAPIKRPWPTADNHFTARDDGLSRPWKGRVWLNPPYGKPSVVRPWMERMAVHNHGTALIFARTETELFFDTVWERATGVLFLKGRLFFHHVTGEPAVGNAGAPSCLVSYGPWDLRTLQNCLLEGNMVTL